MILSLSNNAVFTPASPGMFTLHSTNIIFSVVYEWGYSTFICCFTLGVDSSVQIRDKTVGKWRYENVVLSM